MMANKVYANMMEVSCKAASGKTICAFPDVCMTPPMTPATPPGVPIPYPNTGMASDTTGGSTSVQISGKEIMLKNKSSFSKSSGDEAGSAPKKGVVTSKNMGKVFFNMWSMDVKVEGENVVRHLDITTHNHASMPGNSPPMPHMDGMAPPGGSGGGDEPEACPLDGCCTGSPVNPVLGAKLLSGEEDLDFSLPGPLPLNWQRSYRSTNVRAGWFGQGWGSPLEVCLELAADASGRVVDRVHYVDAFGRRFDFPALVPGGEAYLAAEQYTLRRAQDGQYLLESAQGLTYWFGVPVGGTHLLVAITDRNGNAIRIERPAADHAHEPVRVFCSGRQVLELHFQDGRLTRVVEVRVADGVARGVTLASYSHAKSRQLSAVLDRAGQCLRRFEYNSDGLMQMQRHAEQFEAYYNYAGTGAQSRVVRHWDNVGRAWTFDYLVDSTKVTDHLGRTEVYHFDARRRWTGYTNQAGQFTRRAIDRDGNLRAIIDPAGRATETRFDERANPVAMLDAQGAVTQIEWHPVWALPLAIIDPLGNATRYDYDERGNLIAETDPTGAKTSYRLDERGLVVGVVDAHGGEKKLSYNDAGQVTSYTDCSGHTTTFRYDTNGWLLAAVAPNGETGSYVYDAAGHVVKQTLPDGVSETYENDVLGRMLSVTSAQGARTTFSYEADGLVAQRVDALGHTLRYQYDTARRLLALVNENGARYTFAYDELDRVREETRFDGTRSLYRYDEGSQLIEQVDAPGTPEAVSLHYVRDAVGRVLERATHQTRLRYVYDQVGQVVQAVSLHSGVKVDRQYDAAGRVIEECVTAGARSFSTRYEYDPLGNLLQTILPDGTRLGTLYYGSGHAHQLRLNDQAISDIERDVLHREISRTQGPVTVNRVFDAGGRLVRQHAQGPAAPGGVPLMDMRYQFDASGRMCGSVDRGRALAFAYDAVDQLIGFNEERFAFDPAHNLLPAGGPAGGTGGRLENNRLTVFEDKRYRYDEHGRVVEKRIGAHTTIHLKWDDLNCLVESSSDGPQGVLTTHYLYDAFGRRVAKRNARGTTWYVWDGERLAQQLGDVAEQTFLYEPGSFVPFAQSASWAKGQGSLYYYQCDQIGLPREMLDAQGQQAWFGNYHAWGRLASQQGAVAIPGLSESAMQPLRWQGQYFDEETGLHYNRFRYYDPDAGRFVTPDPIGLEGGFNQYAYAPNPVEWFDPLGLVAHPANCMATTAPSHRYVIVEAATGKLHKTGISSKPLNQNGTSGRANSQVNKLNKKAGSQKYKAVIAEKNISRCAAAQGEQKVVDTYYGRHGKMPPGMEKPIPTVLKK